MSDNFENKENEELEAVEETVEDIIDDATEEAVGVAEAADSISSDVEGVHENMDVSGVEDATEPTVEYAVAESGLEDIPVKNSKGVIIGIVIALIVALLAGTAVMAFFVRKAPYNYLGYINVSGNTVADIAEMQGISLDEFLTAYSLPADMPATTDESAAYYSIPTGVMAQMYGMDFESFKIVLELPDTISEISLRHKIIDLVSDKFNLTTEITEDTPWGIAEGELTLSAYVGDEDAIASFKEEYNLGDDVTADTKWKDVRGIVDKANLEARKAAESDKDDMVVEDASEGEAVEGTVDETAENIEITDVEVVESEEVPAEVADAE